MGRLVRDPELRRTQSGIAVTTMRIAVDRDYKGPDGAKQADFFDVVAWRNTAEFVSRYFAKGRMMIVDGRLQTREWTDRDNNRRTSIEIVADNIYFGDSRRDAPNGESYGGYGSAPGYGSGASGGYGASSGYGSGASGGYGSGGYGSNAGGSAPGYGSGGYGGGYGASSGYGSGASGGYGSGSSAPGYGSGSGGYAYGGYGSGSYGGYGSNNADNAAPSGDSPAPSGDGSAPAEKPAPDASAGFAEIADDDGDLPF
jgi:single-strand DNA-binding protein